MLMYLNLINKTALQHNIISPKKKKQPQQKNINNVGIIAVCDGKHQEEVLLLNTSSNNNMKEVNKTKNGKSLLFNTVYTVQHYSYLCDSYLNLRVATR